MSKSETRKENTVTEPKTKPPSPGGQLADIIFCLVVGVLLGPFIAPKMLWEELQLWYVKKGAIERRKEERRSAENERRGA